MNNRLAAASLFLLTLPSCASTIAAYAERSTRKEAVVPYSRNAIPVSGVSLSASRREIVSANKAGSYYTCSEPAPDAAGALALQSAFALGTKASGSDSVTATALALVQPTEIVEFWRTTSYNYCLLRMNGDPDAAQAYLASAEKFIATLTPKQTLAPGTTQSVVVAKKSEPAPTPSEKAAPAPTGKQVTFTVSLPVDATVTGGK